jgi:hypothetical protein
VTFHLVAQNIHIVNEAKIGFEDRLSMLMLGWLFKFRFHNSTQRMPLIKDDRSDESEL